VHGNAREPVRYVFRNFGTGGSPPPARTGQASPITGRRYVRPVVVRSTGARVSCNSVRRPRNRPEFRIQTYTPRSVVRSFGWVWGVGRLQNRMYGGREIRRTARYPPLYFRVRQFSAPSPDMVSTSRGTRRRPLCQARSRSGTDRVHVRHTSGHFRWSVLFTYATRQCRSTVRATRLCSS